MPGECGPALPMACPGHLGRRSGIGEPGGLSPHSVRLAADSRLAFAQQCDLVACSGGLAMRGAIVRTLPRRRATDRRARRVTRTVVVALQQFTKAVVDPPYAPDLGVLADPVQDATADDRAVRQARDPTTGAALLRWRPNQSLRRRRGRRQLDPSRRGEERQRVRWPTVLLSSATDGGLPLVLARFVRGLSTHQDSGCLRRLRTAATAAKCHRAPVDSHRVADQMPTGPSMSRRRAPHAASPLPRG